MLCMRLIKEHSTHFAGYETHVWNGGYFNDVITALVETTDGADSRAEFVQKYMNEYHDIAVYTTNRLAYVVLGILFSV
jgi:U3 small nucleolar RNA-associated protein 19